MQIEIARPDGWAPEDYALLDSGAGFKLERFGEVTLARPEPQALWQRRLPASVWEAADATFSREDDGEQPGRAGRWTTRRPLPESWPVRWRGLEWLARLTPFKHTGIFPEQAPHWDWIAARLAAARRPVSLLNLFGYTGAAALVAARAGASVTHVDAAPNVLAWARENQHRSGLDAAPIRWIADDALKFTRREARRGARYDLIVLDPPAFGRGPKGEVWKFETALPQLLAACRAVLSDRPLGIVLNSYSIRASSLLLAGLLNETLAGLGGAVQAGELALGDDPNRLLATAIFARWRAPA